MVALWGASALTVSRDVNAHYRGLWGECDESWSFELPNDVVFRVLRWAEGNNPLGVSLYATIGASTHAMCGVEFGHRVEFVLGLSPDVEEVAESLATLASYPYRRGEALGSGHTVSLARPLWRGARVTSFLLSEQRKMKVVPPLLLSSAGTHVEFLQAIPIFEEEREYVRTARGETLLSRFERMQVRFWDPNRPIGV